MNFPWIILGLLTLVRLFFAAFGHLSEVESCLLLFSRHLDWGFVEGPAGMPALMRVSELLLGHTSVAIRSFSPLLLVASSWILWRWVVALCNGVPAEPAAGDVEQEVDGAQQRSVYGNTRAASTGATQLYASAVGLSKNSNQRIAFWTVIAFNVLPLANAAGVVMEGTTVITFCWLLALWMAWRIITSKAQKNKISSWAIFGAILAIGTQVNYQIGLLLPLVAIASLGCFHNGISDKNDTTIISSGWKKFFGVLIAVFILAISWLPVYWWNQTHDWLQFQNMTWDAFWSWPPFEGDGFPQFPILWSLLVLIPLLIAAACCFFGSWEVENPFFLCVPIPLLLCVNELGHGKAPFALILVVTVLFLPIAIEAFLQTKIRKIIGVLLMLLFGCSSLLLLAGKVSSSVPQDSSWNFASARGVIGIEAVAEQLMKLRATYANASIDQGSGVNSKEMQPATTKEVLPEKPESVVNGNAFGKPPFLIAETPGLAAILGAAMPIDYPERPGAPSVFIPESPAFDTQFQLWPHYADATTENTTPDPLYTEEKAVSPFLGEDAFYITTEKLEEIPQTITGAFTAVVPLSVTFTLTKDGVPEQLNLYLCQHYQMLSL